MSETVWPGVPKIGELVRDAALSARTQVAATLTTLLALATVGFTILVTTGQSAATEARIVEQIDSAGTRLIALSDNGGESGILPIAPAQLSKLSDVTWAFGLGASKDVTNPALPVGRAASRLLIGEPPPELTLIQGRMPRPGEAVAGVEAALTLNLGPGLGRVSESGADPVGVVGIFQASGVLAHLNKVVLIAETPENAQTLRYVYVMAADIQVVDRLEKVLATSTPALNLAALTVETPSGAIDFRNVIAGRLGAASRQLMAVIMAISAVIVAVTMFAATIPRRNEFGRRRALGASRSTLVSALLIQTALSAIPGILLGTASGLVTLAATTSSVPTWRFTTGVAGLLLLLTLAASLPVAIVAAHRDPLRILRVP